MFFFLESRERKPLSIELTFVSFLFSSFFSSLPFKLGFKGKLFRCELFVGIKWDFCRSGRPL